VSKLIEAQNPLQLHYQQLMETIKAITILQSATAIMNWDMETKMPPRGIALRSEQLGMLSGIGHKMITNPRIGTLLGKIEENPDYETLDRIRRRNVYLTRKSYDEQTKLPTDLVVETAKQRIITINTWKKAKVAKDFSAFKPELDKLVTLRRKTAEILMEVKKTATLYDALIDIYEPKMTSKMISRIFNKLKEGLISIIDECQAAEKQPHPPILQRKVPIDDQIRISRALAKFIGYDVESESAGGRIDETEHPFTTGYYDDVRITTHYYENKMATSVFSILHEGGHALYEQDLKPEWIYQPIGASCSLGFHESQSRLVENVIGRSREFWMYFLPKLKELTRNIFSDVDLDTFVFAINRVKPSKIRVEADEVTYGLHIIIRFEIECELMSGKITVADLPEIWNQKYKDYLSMDIENDSEGVMQDTHWASGSFGYFPTYALGNIYSGQILNQMQKDIPAWRNQIATGKFHNIKEWLIENVHRYGNLLDPGELIKQITGEEINIIHYLNYLKEKYAKIYGF
jgi:carboxypeptidase Taq